MQQQHSNPFQLLRQRRFAPYFMTQFLGALNDNIYRYALIALISFTIATQNKVEANFLSNLSAALFILPFFIFSALAGQCADKYNKAKLIRIVKFSEILIMSAVGIGFYFHNIFLLMIILFLMGTQSAFFGPVKYSILPQYLKETELVGGNALVETSTFIAILLGMIIGILVISMKVMGPFLLGGITVFTALLGWIISHYIPTQQSTHTISSDIKIEWNLIIQTWHIIQLSIKKRTVFLSILGISWFWFYSTAVFTQIANYNALYLNGNEYVIILLLTSVSVGIGLGSMLCDRLSDHKIEIGLVPFGAIGLTVFTADLSFANGPVPPTIIGLYEFFLSWHNIHILIDIFCIGLFSGFYIVPLYVILQNRSRASIRSRIIAANNIFNSIFMAFASIISITLLYIGFTIPQLFFALSIMTFIVTLFIFTLVPEFLLRFIIWILVHSFYRIRINGIHNLPKKGAAVFAANHVSFIDPLLIMATTKRPIRFVIDYNIFKTPLINLFFKAAKCIPITTQRENPKIKMQAFKEVSIALRKGELIGIFPEGGLTNDGTIKHFQPGINNIIKRNSVPIIPIAIQGLWGSFFSRRYGRAMLQIPRKFPWAEIGLNIGPPILPNKFSLKSLENCVKNLHSDGS